MASMWQKGLINSQDGSTALGVFAEASDWLSEHLGEDETALVPMRDVFDALNPQMHDKLVDYKSIWESAGIILQANTTEEEKLTVRRYFINFLKENPQIRYMVRDWVDPYAKFIYGATVNDELMFLISEAEVIPFTLSTGWSSKITIYQRVQYVTSFCMNFSSPPKLSFAIPEDAQIQYDENGAAIQKLDSRVSFYYPLEEGINASRKNCLILQIRPEIEKVELTTAFYYDVNRDGTWSGYEIDYAKSATFNQTQLGWVTGEWYTIYQVIPQAGDPVVQIGIILAGDATGTVTLRDLEVYTEIPFEK